MSQPIDIDIDVAGGPARPPLPGAPRPGVLRRLLRKPAAAVSLAFVAVVAVAGALAPQLTANSPTASEIANALAPMGGNHPLGTDGVGRDVLAQLLYGSRTSLTGALIVVAVSLLIGLPAGVLAGYHRGWFDGLANWLGSLVMALPAIIVLLVVLAQWGRSTALAMTVFGFLIAPGVFRLVRSSVIAVREELYVDAARVSGLGDARIMRRHILPVVVAPTVIQASQLLGIAIVIQAGLEFLGLGSANQASWGGMLSNAFQNVYFAPRLLLWPALAIVLTVTAFCLIGNALRDALGAADAGRRARRRTDAAAGPVVTAAHDAAAQDPPADALLAVQDLHAAYPRPDGTESVVVQGVSLTVRRGEILGLVGESGSGKSQTAFSVLGLLPPQARTSATRLLFDGQDLRGLSPAAMNKLRGRRIGYIPQEPMSNLDPSFRIGAQLTEPMRHHLGLSRAQARTEALRLLERVGIADPARVFASYPHQVSGGMAQRVLIAGAVSCDPDLLIADEPTTALDVTVQAEVLDLLRELQAERRMGVILVTHDFGVVADLCDTVAVMQSGRIVETAPATELFAAPRHPYTRMLLDATLEDSTPRSARAVATPAAPSRSVLDLGGDR
ncbi:dipeptide/oligopeptide/nickel ABC transporter ATP-binding protein [Streptomyces humidus]|uniref:Dipeptide/oligopeptide/nickel ABC transporter ATP-binding protein n=1 Tax=Streptomyces humidus TaxID=52259 RepID=A0A918G8A0_9ACTN|nr:dipeptide/oligopeptide/nickel ABC transporter permease/ATP-binding protein [Streptomyces humidus]GGS23664.1 dipeptide/oligopeptide/nickel ABC transporter ATP-binding protein [Streptomyces humidus]